MIQLIHLATGPGWHPATVRLNMPENSAVKVCPLLAKSEIHFSQVDSAFSIPRELFCLPVKIDAPSVRNLRSNIHGNLTTEITNAIRQIINTYAVGTQIGISEVARLTDMSVRTLQRQLKHHGLKFNDLLNQAKFEHAKQMLNRPEVSIKAVAQSLGYSDSAHFTRAFRRWSGLAPTAFRKDQQNSA
jgi:AraC-like DNA-binding protein